jgi:hypothetical protein
MASRDKIRFTALPYRLPRRKANKTSVPHANATVPRRENRRPENRALKILPLRNLAHEWGTIAVSAFCAGPGFPSAAK